ncbi:MAG TPA: hybrid sensor histidine kinase/response regulator, partial [Verrucomicrobiae bacterium]|nr:hybrid sensor histidine kinase/response regulator [Verrucomicrobiae bacterium]
IQLNQLSVDSLLRGLDLLINISKRVEEGADSWEKEHAAEIADCLQTLTGLGPQEKPAGTAVEKRARATTPAKRKRAQTKPVVSTPPAGAPDALPTQKRETSDRVLRLTAENLNRLLGLAGESLVESRWLRPYSDSMQRLKRLHNELLETLDGLRWTLEGQTLSERAETQLGELFQKANECRVFLGERLQELDLFDRRSANLSHRLYLEVLRTRMRPFADGVNRFPRMVRDLARSLGKEVKFEIIGENTQVDRDILERLEMPLTHLLQNALDHGCEKPELRRRDGKPPEATVRLEARHSAGMLLVTVTDDGAGIDPESVRQAVIERKLATAAVAQKFTETELLDFLFLPGFTLKKTVTEISGRGVGLDVVQDVVKTLRGTIRASTQPGRETRFQLQLPLTLSVLRTLLVEIGGEPYAIPLTQISQTVKLEHNRIETLEGRHHFRSGKEQIGLLMAHQVLGIAEPKPPGGELPVVVLGDRSTRYGLIVDRFLGERELVVQPLDPRLGKIKDISAAALMEDGAPVLIVDVDDMVRSIGKLIAGGELGRITRAIEPAKPLKRILTIDDSLTVRELERKLLTSRGYQADVAVDGMDGWHAVRTGEYDLVITDVDMPRMNGIELTTLIKNDPNLKSLPVMIVSYKDREQDWLQGLQAGADYYLTKGSFEDETLIQAVIDLIGEPEL